MFKIPVGGTIVHGYGFAARRIISNVGLIWLAGVFYAVAVTYWLQQFSTTMLVSPHPGSELNDFAWFDLIGLLITTALGSAVIARALTGTALEPGGETMTAYFAIAKREWLLFLSVLGLYVFVIAALFAVIFLGRFAIAMALPMIGANAQWQGIDALQAMEAAVSVVAFIVVAMLAVRLGFFAAAIASAERSMSMTRAWSISSGNSWRVFAVVLGLTLPVLLLWAAAEWVLMGSDLAAAVTAAASAHHDSTALYQLIGGNALAIAGAWTLLVVVLNMLFAGASAPAYLAVQDNVSSRRERSVQNAPAMEPAFAGSFAGFAPRQTEEPAPSGFAQHAEVFAEHETSVTAAKMPAETFAAETETVDAPVAEVPVEATVAETEAVMPPVEEAAPLSEGEHHAAEAPVHEEPTHEPLTLADEIHATHDAHGLPVEAEADQSSVMQFPLGVAEHPAEHAEVAHAEAAEITPLPSHGDAPESSQQNAPSEAA